MDDTLCKLSKSIQACTLYSVFYKKGVRTYTYR